MNIKLTQTIVESLTCPEGKRRIEYCDASRSGLYVEVRATSPGQGTYYLRYKDPNGKTRHTKIGRTTEIDLVTAREKAKTLKAQITLGADPSAEAKAKKSVLTLAEFFDDHYLPYAKPRKRTADKDAELFRLRLRKRFGPVKLNRISRHQVQVFHTELHEDGLSPASCDHYLKLLRRMLNLAVQWQMIETNPIDGISLFNANNTVDHYLKPEELQRLLTVLRTDRNRPVCSIAMFLLATGARLNEAMQARWDHVDTDNRVWRIPAPVSKSKKVRSVPLNDAALSVIQQLDTEETFDHLFINRRTKKPYTTIHKVWERLREEAGLPKLRIHDLRHQYASHLVNNGRSLYEVQAILGHSDPKVTQRYAHLSTVALQAAADAAGKVIEFRPKKAS